MTTASKSFQTVNEGTKGHYEEKPSKFKFVFVVWDVFSRLLEISGLLNATAANVNDSLGLFSPIDAPELIIYDDEPTFIS